MLREVETGAGTLRYELTRKAVRRLNLRVGADGRIAVSIPRRLPAEAADAFVREKADWIARVLERQAARRKADGDGLWLLGERIPLRIREGEREEAVLSGGALTVLLPPGAGEERAAEAVKRFLERAGGPVFEDALRRMHRLAAPLGVPFPQMTTRWARARWGSCTAAKGRISINKALICAPPACIDYVLLHELVHFLHPDHSPAFYACLASLMPDYRERERAIRRFDPARCLPFPKAREGEKDSP